MDKGGAKADHGRTFDGGDQRDVSLKPFSFMRWIFSESDFFAVFACAFPGTIPTT